MAISRDYGINKRWIGDKCMREKICAIVVTYNRKFLLIRCLESLIKNTKRVDAIYIIDNASTDGTSNFLYKKGYISANNVERSDISYKYKTRRVRIKYIRLSMNTGGAGGFYEGLKCAYNDGYAWFWIMDDDVEIVKNGLEKMLKYTKIAQCIHPAKRYYDGEKIRFEGYFDLRFPKTVFFKEDISFKNGKDFTFINYGCFEGMLIHREIVKKIGFPDKRFFITWDDTIYGFLASLYTNNIYINEVVLIKRLKSSIHSLTGKQVWRMSNLATFHYIKNYFIVFEYLKKFGTLSFLAYIFLIIKCIRMSLGALLHELNFKKIFLIWKGFFIGLFKKYNK